MCISCYGDICCSVFLCMTTDAVSDEWCVFKINFYIPILYVFISLSLLSPVLRSVLGNVG